MTARLAADRLQKIVLREGSQPEEGRQKGDDIGELPNCVVGGGWPTASELPLRADTRRSAAAYMLPQFRPFLPSGLGPLSAQLRRPRPRSATTALRVRRDKAALSSGGAPPGQPLQPEATGAVMEVTKWLKPSV